MNAAWHDPGVPSVPGPTRVSRRAALSAGWWSVVVAAGAAGCTDRQAGPGARASGPTPGAGPATTGTAPGAVSAPADLAVVAALVSQGRSLLREVPSPTSAPAVLDLAQRVSRDHVTQLEALGAQVPAQVATTPTPAARLQLDESTTGAQALTAALAPQLSAGLATLAARVGAGRLVHADLYARARGVAPPPLPDPALLGGLTVPLLTSTPTPSVPAAPTTTDPTTTDPTTTDPTTSTPPATSPAAASGVPGAQDVSATDLALLQTMLAGEHAACYAFEVVLARAPGTQRAQAQRDLTAHLRRRDALLGLLIGVGVVPVAAEPGYDLDPTLPGPPGAADLAARVERNLAAVAAAGIGTAGPAVRRLQVDALADAARRRAAWTGATSALPGA